MGDISSRGMQSIAMSLNVQKECYQNQKTLTEVAKNADQTEFAHSFEK